MVVYKGHSARLWALSNGHERVAGPPRSTAQVSPVHCLGSASPLVTAQFAVACPGSPHVLPKVRWIPVYALTLGRRNRPQTCLLYTSDAADDLLCVDLGGRRIIKKKKIK